MMPMMNKMAKKAQTKEKKENQGGQKLGSKKVQRKKKRGD